MEKTLELVFNTQQGAKKIIRVANPRDNVTHSEAEAVMATIAEQAVFKGTASAGEITEPVEARLRTSEVTVLL